MVVVNALNFIVVDTQLGISGLVYRIAPALVMLKSISMTSPINDVLMTQPVLFCNPLISYVAYKLDPLDCITVTDTRALNERTIEFENPNPVINSGLTTLFPAVNDTSLEMSPREGVISTVLANNDFAMEAPPAIVSAPPTVPLEAFSVLLIVIAPEVTALIKMLDPVTYMLPAVTPS